ncbi:response regulator [Marinobacterium lutimaris]|uniref:Response regulator receiver domain-containing protein n=1 Tax=Marinobacterium lutimaris TaxID=568106 RepID=A0A1H6D6A1_9GAMM|nr:response regulator [Marinobacterium lutimaris]SEG80801.1 Response regulator receiver domain-containing protein [Marinobacterium lutimaris]
MHIGTLGFPDDQFKKLEKILTLSKQKSFTLCPFEPASTPDLMLVFGEENLATDGLAELPDDFGDRMVVVSRTAPAREDLHHIKLPFISSRVIRTLERFDPYLPTLNEAVESEQESSLEPGQESEPEFVADEPPEALVEPDQDEVLAEAPPAAEVEPENRFSKYDAQIQALREQGRDQAVADRPYRVLVVDDSVPMQQALAKALHALEYPVEISFADDGEAALAEVGRQPFDFIFLDIMMPGIDGFETCTRMRAIPELKKTPIIMLSSKSSPLDEVKGIMAGSSTYLTKPIQTEEFSKVIKRVTRWVSEFKKA